MKTLARHRSSLAGFVLALTASTIACAPATFDGITGGKDDGALNPRSGEQVVDPSLAPPRPVSPISVSWVNTLKPRFRWELGERNTGAIIQLSDKRDFSGEVRELKADGTEKVLEEDLKPGFWFWRLRGRVAPSETNAEEIVGPEADENTPVWQLLVRGPGPNGASDVPSGGIFDIDGDGIPDLMATARVAPDFFEGGSGPKPTEPLSLVLQWLGQPDGTFLFHQQTALEVPDHTVSLTGSVDTDGDGYTDFALPTVWESPEAPGGLFGDISVFHGGPEGLNAEKDEYKGFVIAPYFTELPEVRAAGDVNGDGYGDLVVMFPDLAYAALGTREMGVSSMMVFPAPSGGRAPRSLLTSFDLDNDGLPEIGLPASAPTPPLAFVRGHRDRFTSLGTLAPTVDMTAAAAVASGDVDGDGRAELVFSTTIAGAPAVCLYALDSGVLGDDRCWKGEGPTDGFGEGLAVADIDADGKDEIIVASKSGVMLLRYLGPASFESVPIEGSFRPSIAVIHPGRPGPAKWAILGADAKSITVFDGTVPGQKFDVASDPQFLELGPSIR